MIIKTKKGGRPKLEIGKKTASILIHLTPDEKVKVTKKAKRIDMSVSEYARNLVFDKLEKQPKFRMLPNEIRNELNELRKTSGLLKLLALKLKVDETLKIKFREAENEIFNSVRYAEKLILQEILNPQFLQTLNNAIMQIELNIAESDTKNRGELKTLKMLLLDILKQHTAYYE